MRLYRRGDSGEPVRDIQGRLDALGFACGTDAPGVFAEGTWGAVVAFQTARGLSPDGIVGPDTWRGLVAAGYRLGDRMLYYRVPMMRGDDVADLQRRFNALGFDAGKVDGIFGPDTLAAVLDFQSNRNMAEDGIAGTDVVVELELIARATHKPGREVVRDHEWLANLPATVAGQRVYVDAFCRTDEEAEACWGAASALARSIQEMGGLPHVSRSADTRPPQRVRALRANRLGVDLVIAFALPINDRPAVHFFASEHSSSEAGRLLATEIGRKLGLEPVGRSIPMLKDTRSPAVVVAAGVTDETTGEAAAAGMRALFAAAAEARGEAGEPERERVRLEVLEGGADPPGQLNNRL
jgi:N-acetylmuramoyl-L-alanine amidase